MKILDINSHWRSRKCKYSDPEIVFVTEFFIGLKLLGHSFRD